MSLRMEAVTFDVPDAAATARFWAGLLDRDVHDGAYLPGDGPQVGLRFVTAAEPGGPQRLHLHLTSQTAADQQRIVARALGLGGRPCDVGQQPDDTHVVLADPAGYAFCVIEPGNGFLAGAGFLGEVTCDGSRAAARFWRDALGWDVVWDEGDQLAIQSPAGGTKLSWDAWDGATGDGQWFDLVADDPAAEADRLVGLGATRGSDASQPDIELADPDGRRFRLRPQR